MPCRCDGYEVTAGEVRAEMNEKVKHLEGQLCNAQSLIHKLLKFMDNMECFPESHCGGGAKLPKELRARADAHIKVLLDHKKKEHAEEVEAARRALRSAEDMIMHQTQVVSGQANALSLTREEAKQLRDKLDAMVEVSDDEILG